MLEAGAAHRMRRAAIICCFIVVFYLALCGCNKNGEHSHRNGRISVVTTLFPLYDFARQIGGERADVTLLLPPGVEPHNFDPRPRDILAINKADLFVYTGNFMEPWAAGLIKGIKKSVLVIDSSAGVTLLKEVEVSDEPGDHAGATGKASHDEPIDPHIWLDFGNAQKIVDNILAGFVEKDSEHRAFYEKNAADYKAKLRALDQQFADGLKICRTRLFVHGGHYAFNYLARRYGLTYISVYGFSPNAEPSPRHLANIVQTMRQNHVSTIFYEELIQPRVAETIARETGARLLPLSGSHNVTKNEFDHGVTFISILKQDLFDLRKGLQCQ
jgi:zinc transport system substrate-binding protein